MSTDDDAGSVTVMILGFLTLLLLVIALVVDSSSYFLTRRDDQAFCDQLSLLAARETSAGTVLEHGATPGGGAQELVPQAAQNPGLYSPDLVAAVRSRPDITVTGPTYTASGTRVTYSCTEHAHPPFTGAFADDGLPVTATSTAIQAAATSG